MHSSDIEELLPLILFGSQTTAANSLWSLKLEENPTSCSSKRCSHQIPTGLKILRKQFLARRFDQFETHFFGIFLYFRNKKRE